MNKIKPLLTLLLLLALASTQTQQATASVVVPALPGDYNQDGTVDNADQILWRKYNGMQIERYTLADGNGDGLVDDADYEIWRSHFGQSLTDHVVTITPGDNIATIVESRPAGTTFRLTAGTHRITTSLTPKDGMKFIGEPGTVLTGAKTLSNFSANGSRWFIGGQTQRGYSSGECDPTHPRCNRPEDLYYDDKPLTHVASLGEVGPGKWFFDYDNNRIYIGDNPAGHRIETSVAESAFRSNASNVEIHGLAIEKFATPSQQGAIQAEGPGWKVADNTVRLNHAVGIAFLADNCSASHNHIETNGQLGVSCAGGNACVFEANEIAHNNFAGFAPGWEAGGGKFTRTTDLVLRSNNVHHNHGPGLWTDIYNLRTLYDSNTCDDNAEAGIFHEISYDVDIRNNTCRRNAATNYPWLYGAQILISSSSNADIHHNTVETNGGGNGITVLNQQRDPGPHGPCYARNNYVHHNTIIVRSNSGNNGPPLTGAATDFDNANFWATANNRFDYNTYHLPNLTTANWAWADSERTWTDFRARDQEPHGTADTNIPTP